ncbi:hypothetical protein HYT23_01030 [Candidatus Pacearchaeota archaeon]|nr:hypothetical protein [Candidatus Pacearchaeota archaeon]
MGELKIKLPEKIEEKFRRLAMAKFGYQKGSISEAAQEAIESWTFSYIEPEDIEDPIETISGIMKNVKKSSVELQHEAWEGVIKKHARRH